MKRWERIGFGSDFIRRVASNLSCVDSGPPDRSPPCDVGMVLGGHVSDCAGIAYLHLLEVDAAPWTLGDAAKMAAETGVEYFFGTWRRNYRWEGKKRETIGPEECRQRLGWYDQYTRSLLCASLIDDARLQEQLLSWPGEDLPRDDGSFDASPLDNDFHIYFAFALRNEHRDHQKLRAGLTKFKSGKSRLKAACADAIANGDGAEFGSRYGELLKRFKRPEPGDLNPLNVFDVDARLLMYFAKRRGLTIPSLGQLQRDLLGVD